MRRLSGSEKRREPPEVLLASSRPVSLISIFHALRLHEKKIFCTGLRITSSFLFVFNDSLEHSSFRRRKMVSMEIKKVDVSYGHQTPLGEAVKL